ncbi:MAG: N-acetyl sugar amidotransferase [Fibrobacterota bacterium]|nr:N-acetyl sugar amidotransferase [Fibrobacterota bacterium]
MVFDDEGVCMGCRVHEEKDALDWTARFSLLNHIVRENSKRMGGKGFDCIVPVTGGADSYFIVHTVKNILGMNPLLVTYNAHYNTTVGIRNLANLATVFDCDLVTSTLSPSLLKRLTRKTLKKFGHMYWHVLAGNLTFPVQMAVKFRIPLIIWGVQPWSEQTGMYSHLDEVEMTERCRKEHGLLGFAAESLIDPKEGIFRRDVQPWVYPYDNELEAVGVRGIYLSNYIRWDSKTQHELMIKSYGYETASQQRTFNTYEDVACAHSAGLHDYLKYLKYGYGKITDHASREIRLKRMTREEGAKLVAEYTGKKPKDLATFLQWIEMGEDEFWKLADQWRDPQIWKKDGSGKYQLMDSITEHAGDQGVDEVRLEKTGDWHYQLTGAQEPETHPDRYLLMGRGYIDKFNFGAIDPLPAGGKLLPREWKRKPMDLGNKYEIL